jgi:hypothetical protein
VHLEGCVEGWDAALPVVLEAYVAVGRPEGHSSRLVAVAVEVEVEAGARSQLEHSLRPAGQARHLEETADQSAAARGLVGLEGMAEIGQHLGVALRVRLAHGGPSGVGVAVAPGRGVVGREVGALPCEHLVMDAGQGAEGVVLGGGIGRVGLEQSPGGAAGADVVAHVLEQPHVERRGRQLGHAPVLVDGGDQFGAAIDHQARNRPSSRARAMAAAS